MAAKASFVSLRELLSSWDDPGTTPVTGDGCLDRVGIDDFDIVEGVSSLTLRFTLSSLIEIGFNIPGLDGLGFYFGAGGGVTSLPVEVEFNATTTKIKILEAAPVV